MDESEVFEALDDTLPRIELPSLEKKVQEDQRTILAIARTEDNPSSMRQACDEAERKGKYGGYQHEANKIIAGAWKTYINSQTEKARSYAEAGNLPAALEHFGNIEQLPATKLPARYEDNKDRIVEVGVRTTPAEVCLEKALEYAKAGELADVLSLCKAASDCENTKYEVDDISPGLYLTINDEDASNRVSVYGQMGERHDPLQKPTLRTRELGRKIQDITNIAYEQAIENQIMEAIGYAVTWGRFDEEFITTKLEYAEKIMEHRIFSGTKPEELGKELANFEWYKQTVLHPFTSMLLDCNNDRSHPLRALYETKRDEDRKIIGASITTSDKEQYLSLIAPTSLIAQVMSAPTGTYTAMPLNTTCMEA